MSSILNWQVLSVERLVRSDLRLHYGERVTRTRGGLRLHIGHGTWRDLYHLPNSTIWVSGYHSRA